MTRRTLPRGIRYHGAGLQAEVRVTGHPRSVEQFALDELDRAVEWRKDEKARLRLTSPRASKGTFTADAKRYLHLVRTMPSLKMRTRDIELWVAVFGTRSRSSITTVEIRAQALDWVQHGPKRRWLKTEERPRGAWYDVPGPLAASTVNHRLRALANLWTVLDGLRAPNPAREVPEFEEPEGEERGYPYDVVEAVIAAMPDLGRPIKGKGVKHGGQKGEGRPAHSQTKARARVIAYVGLEHSAIEKLTRSKINFEEQWVDTGKRRKGKGALAARLPLTEHGVAALREFDALDCYGTFSASSMRKSIRRACEKVAQAVEPQPGGAELAAALRRLRPYDLRHAYVSEVLEKSGGDFRATQLLARHADLRTTLRYGKRSVNPVLAAALARVTSAGGFGAGAKLARSSDQATAEQARKGQSSP